MSQREKHLPIYPWQSLKLLQDLLHIRNKNEQETMIHTGWPIAYTWARAQCSIHIHGRVFVRSEAKAGDYCWMYWRHRNTAELPLDWLHVGSPTKTVDQLISAEHSRNSQRTMLIDLGKLIEQYQRTVLGLWMEEGLRLLEDCPCLPIDWEAEQWTWFSPLRCSFHFVQELFRGLTDWEAMGLLEFLIFPKNKLVNSDIECCPHTIETISHHRHNTFGKSRDRTSIYNLTSLLVPKIYSDGIGMLSPEHPDFLIERATMFIGPLERSESII